MKFYNVFSRFLTGATKEAYLKNLGDNKFNSLHSYWYLKDLSDEKIQQGFEMTKGNIMIDSGAFTASNKNIEINVDTYIKWINKWDKYITLFGQIDVIPPKKASSEQLEECCKKTWDNYLYMKEKIRSPEKLLYTFHYGEDYKWLEQALEYRDSKNEQIKYMALGGLVGRSQKQRVKFLNKCFEIINNSSNPNIKIHAFGVCSEKLWSKYKFESADSSTPRMEINRKPKNINKYYTMKNYERIFKPRGWKKQATPKNIEKIEETKLLVDNIKYYNDLANSINKE